VEFLPYWTLSFQVCVGQDTIAQIRAVDQQSTGRVRFQAWTVETLALHPPSPYPPRAECARAFPTFVSPACEAHSLVRNGGACWRRCRTRDSTRRRQAGAPSCLTLFDVAGVLPSLRLGKHTAAAHCRSTPPAPRSLYAVFSSLRVLCGPRRCWRGSVEFACLLYRPGWPDETGAR